MNLKPQRFSLQLAFTILLLAALVVAFVAYTRAEKAIDRANEQRILSQLLADKLRQSSDDLTRMVRTYVVTGDPRYRQYYQDILDIRDGRKPRPEHYQNIYWDRVIADQLPPPATSGPGVPLLDLMRQAEFGAAEFHKLAEAKANSDQLTATEFAAMQQVETADRTRKPAGEGAADAA